MKLDNLKKASDANFRRITGVKRKTFDTMVKILNEAHIEKKKKGGRPNTFGVEIMLLMALEYIREYRTYATIGASYGLSESNTYETIKWVENVLIKSPEFRLPGRKALLKSDNEYEIILIDATESPIERPKKNSADFIREKRRDIR
jgi:hypothetical protein